MGDMGDSDFEVEEFSKTMLESHKEHASACPNASNPSDNTPTYAPTRQDMSQPGIAHEYFSVEDTSCRMFCGCSEEVTMDLPVDARSESVERKKRTITLI